MADTKANRFDRKLLLPMILGSIMNPINSSIIAVALIPIGIAFGAPPSQTAWLVSALYLTTAIGQPVVGKLIDLYGPKLLYLISTAIVGVGSLVAFFAPNIWWLVAARVLLGLGTCAGYPSSMFLIRMESKRTGEKSPSGILASLAFANQSIAAIGPLLGGVLIQYGGWQSAFIVNLPVSIACLIFGGLWYPKGGGEKAENLNIDFVGMGLFAVMMISLLMFLMSIKVDSLYLLILSVVVLAVFAFYELRVATAPFIPLKVLAGNKPLIITYIRTLLTATVCYSFLYGISQWLQQGRGLSSSVAGTITIPLAVVALIVVSLTGKNPRIYLKMVVGAVALIAAFILQLIINGDSPIIILLVITALSGVPQGLNNLANQNALYYQAVPEQLASSTGLMRTFQYLGAMLAAAANGIFLANGAQTAGIHNLAVFQIVITLLLLALIVFDKSVKGIGNNNEQSSRKAD